MEYLCRVQSAGETPMNFIHLNQKLRNQIEHLLTANKKPSAIAMTIGFDLSTIYREIARGQKNGRYNALSAQERSDKRKKKSAGNVVRKPGKVWRNVASLLTQDWAPEQICGRIKLFKETTDISISHQAIYNWMGRTKTPLARHFRRPEETLWGTSSGGIAKDRPKIKDRPKYVASRNTLGHFEGDTIRGKSALNCIVTLVERKSLYLLMSPVIEKKATTVAKSIRQCFRSVHAKTLTLDNGSEFAAFKDLGVKTYFADPGCPRQRARNELTNGLIRQYLPKRKSMDQLTRRQIKRIQDKLNHRPRKSLGYKTPHEVLFGVKPIPFAIRT